MEGAPPIIQPNKNSFYLFTHIAIKAKLKQLSRKNPNLLMEFDQII